MPGPWRSYTEAERAEAVGVAMTIGTKRAAAQLGIPRRTLSSWLQRPSPGVQEAIARTGTDVAATFWQVVDRGTQAMLAKIDDPKTRAGELAQIVKTAVESHALITGGATSRTANVNVNVDAAGAFQEASMSTLDWDEEMKLRSWLDALLGSNDDELREWALAGGIEMFRKAQDTADKFAEDYAAGADPQALLDELREASDG